MKSLLNIILKLLLNTKKIFYFKNILLISFLLFTIQVKSINLPTIGTITNDKMLINNDNNFIIVTGISDGDIALNQTVTMTAVSSNTSILSVTSVNYTNPDGFAVIKIKEFGVSGSVTLTITATDADGPKVSNFSIAIGDFYQKGVRFQIHDLVYWQNLLPFNDTPLLDSVIASVNSPTDNEIWNRLPLSVGLASSNDKDDFCTMAYKGYIKPTISGTYTFSYEGFDDSKFQIFSSADYDQIPIGSFYRSTLINQNSSTTTTSVNLTAGQTYLFYATNYKFLDNYFKINWTYPGQNLVTPMSGNQILPYLFNSNPLNEPLNLQVVRYSKDAVELRWNSVTNAGINYKVYLNDKVYFTTTNTIIITSLTSNTFYSAAVSILNENKVESLPSIVVNFNTPTIESILPNPPTISASILDDVAIVITFSGAADPSGIYGYNIYVNNQINKQIYPANSTTILGLLPSTNYNIQIESVDGNYNVSAKSNNYVITTNTFDYTSTPTGAKKAKVTFFQNYIARNEGIGINNEWDNGNLYTTSMLGIHQDLKPSNVVLGTLNANSKSFANDMIGNKPTTYGKYLNFANSIGAYCTISIGTSIGKDWRDNSTLTALNFLEYIAGNSSTTYGAIRASEGFSSSLLTISKGLIINLGTEVWGGASTLGGANHNADGFDNYAVYGPWARSMARAFKSSPYYDSTKIKIAYSGREISLADSYGLTQTLYTLQNGEVAGSDKVDGMSVSGYQQPNYVESNGPLWDQTVTGTWIDQEARLKQLEKNISQIGITKDYIETMTGYIKPIYIYEGNNINFQNSKPGQPMQMVDFYSEMIINGVSNPNIFTLQGGLWGILQDNYTKKLPLYDMIKLYNTHTKGNVLQSQFQTSQYIKDYRNNEINIDPVNVKCYQNGNKYAILLMSRDFKNDYAVELNMPNGSYSATASRFEISTTTENSQIQVMTTVNMNFSATSVVHVPKYAMVVITFTGPQINLLPVALGYSPYKRPTSVSVSINNGIGEQTNFISNEVITVNANFLPSNSSNQKTNWQVLKNNNEQITLQYFNKNLVMSFSGASVNTVNGLSVFTVIGSQFENPNLRITKIINVTKIFEEGCLPQIVIQPQNKSYIPGFPTSLMVSATGTNLTYIWSNGATTPEFSTTIVGTYQVTVVGACGSKISQPVEVTLSTNRYIYIPSTINLSIGDTLFVGVQTQSNDPLVYSLSDNSLAELSSNRLVGLKSGFATVSVFQPATANSSALPTVTIPLNITSTRGVNFDISGSKFIPFGKVITYSQPFVAGYTYTWSFSGTGVLIVPGTDKTSNFKIIFLDGATAGNIISIVKDQNQNIVSSKTFRVEPLTDSELELTKNLPKIDCPIEVLDCKSAYITSVKMGTLSNLNTGCSRAGFGDYTLGLKLDSLMMGDAYDLNLESKTSDGKSAFFAVWIDYNNNGKFTDQDDFVAASFENANAFEIKNIIIKNQIEYEGPRRLRVSMRADAAIAPNDPCAKTGGSGETEDYLVFIRKPDDLQAASLVTPNNDGKNDRLIIRGINVKEPNKLTIMDRYGEMIYETTDYKNDWEGTNNQKKSVMDGTYYYFFVNGKKTISGFVELRRK